MDDLVVILIILAIQGIWTLITLYITEKVKQAARGAVDESVGKALNEQRHEFERGLEEVRLERDRLAQDFGLFASKRNEVYAEVYSHFTKTVGRLHSVVGFSEGYSFDKCEREFIERYLMTEADVTDARQTQILGLWDRDRQGAVRELNQVQHDQRRRKAEAAFREAKNAAVLNELYFSPEVDAAIHGITQAIAKIVVRLRGPDDREGDTAWDAQQAAERDLNELKGIMQVEMRRGFTALPAQSK